MPVATNERWAQPTMFETVFLNGGEQLLAAGDNALFLYLYLLLCARIPVPRNGPLNMSGIQETPPLTQPTGRFGGAGSYLEYHGASRGGVLGECHPGLQAHSHLYSQVGCPSPPLPATWGSSCFPYSFPAPLPAGRPLKCL
jgi:hypothetical protein